MGTTRRRGLILAGTIAAAVALFVGTSMPASADPISAGKASAQAVVGAGGGQGGGTEVAEVTAPTADDNKSVINTDPPVAATVLGAIAKVHADSDIPAELPQSSDGPFNAQGLSEIVELALGDTATPNSMTVDAITAEAVAVCTGGRVVYSANSSVVGLVLGGVDVGEQIPEEDILKQITDGLNGSPLAALIKIEFNVIEETATGITVDALKLTLGGEEGGYIAFGRAAVSDVQCGETTTSSESTTTETVAGNVVLPTSDPLPRTGGTSPVAVAAVLGAGGLALYALRRRIV